MNTSEPPPPRYDRFTVSGIYLKKTTIMIVRCKPVIVLDATRTPMVRSRLPALVQI